jgi:hypothetical protein
MSKANDELFHGVHVQRMFFMKGLSGIKKITICEVTLDYPVDDCSEFGARY